VRKLDIAAIVRFVFAIATDPQFLLRAAGVWYLVVAVLMLVPLALTSSDPAPPSFPVVSFLAPVVCYFGVSLALVGTAVNTHRRILLDEMPARVRLSRIEWRYFLRGIWICALPAIVGFVAILAFNFWEDSAAFHALVPEAVGPSAHWVVGGLLLLLGGYFFIQFSLSLPAAAIGRPEFTASKGLDASSRNEWRLIALAIIFLVAPSLIGDVIIRMIESPLEILPRLLKMPFGTLVVSVVWCFQAVLWAATLSCAFAGLVDGDPRFAVADTAAPFEASPRP
jgi:hypothetical protein